MWFHNVSQKTLKAVAVRPVRASQLLFTCPHAHARLVSQCRYQSSGPERIAILGGGVAGLSSAYFVAKHFPKSKITLFEAGNDPGGWIRTRRIEVTGANGDKGTVLFEQGPRALRTAPATAALIESLGLVNDVLCTRRTEPGAKNRFIYYPDELVRLPSPPISISDVVALWRTGLLKSLMGIVAEAWEPKVPELEDETVGSFIARRMGKPLADNIVSGVFHGIYAGDIWQLSAKSVLAKLWNMEKRFSGIIFPGLELLQNDKVLVSEFDRAQMQAMKQEMHVNDDFWKLLNKSAQFAFTDGLQQLIRALVDAVEKMGNVEIKTMSPIQSFSPLSEGDKLGVEVVSGQKGSTSTDSFDVAISTLREESLTPYVTVMTINLYYPNPNLLPVEGFGYLIPQSVPFSQNPERGLGVIFDSSAVKGQDTVPGTKLTVMMGGHWWNDWQSYPTEAEGLEMAKSMLARHLNITDEPTAHFVNLAKDCIPQYTLGYHERMLAFKRKKEAEFKGRVKFVGSQYNGVGVNDCIQGAWTVANDMKTGGWRDAQDCGLGRFVHDDTWVTVGKGHMDFREKG